MNFPSAAPNWPNKPNPLWTSFAAPVGLVARKYINSAPPAHIHHFLLLNRLPVHVRNIHILEYPLCLLLFSAPLEAKTSRRVLYGLTHALRTNPTRTTCLIAVPFR